MLGHYQRLLGQFEDLTLLQPPEGAPRMSRLPAPGLRPLGTRSDLGAGLLNPSVDGGRLLLELFCANLRAF
jgi:hypothetical protein